MQMNCDSVNKLVKQLQTDRDALLARERRDSSFSYLVGESAIIPEYHFTVVQDQIDRYNQRIIALKHIVNEFNLRTKLPGLNQTIDEALIRMAMLNSEKHKLERMRNATERSRTTTMRGVSEVTAINYSLADAQKRYEDVSAELKAIQQALNIANLTLTMGVPDSLAVG